MKLELYHMTYCPFCRKVDNYIRQSGRSDITYRDIQKDKEAYRTLLEVGKIDQVPCLMIDGTPLYESDDIIAFLKEHE